MQEFISELIGKLLGVG